MMKRTCNPWGIAGLVLCCQAATCLAGESVKTEFNGWTVTITPRQATPLAVVRQDEADDSSRIVVASARSMPKIVPIRRVSMLREEPVEEPSAIPNLATTPAAPVSTTVIMAENQVPTPAVETVTPRANPASAAPVPAPAVQSQPVVNYEYSPRLPAIVPRPRVEPINPQVYVAQTALYRDIYFSIPFNRAEYDAYPSYRHDATMELLFNQMRPTIIQRGPTPVNYLGMNGGSGFPNGYPYTYPYQPYYPFSYGLRIHRNP